MVEIFMWGTANSTEEWLGSALYVPAGTIVLVLRWCSLSLLLLSGYT